jgi:hypothetical protein
MAHTGIRRIDPFRCSGFLRDYKKFFSKTIIKEMAPIHQSRVEWLLNKFIELSL